MMIIETESTKEIWLLNLLDLQVRLQTDTKVTWKREINFSVKIRKT